MQCRTCSLTCATRALTPASCSAAKREWEQSLYSANMAAPTPRRRLWEIVRHLWRELHDDGLFDTAAGVAFWLLLSIPAALLATLSSVSLLGENLTADLQASINEFIDRTFTTESSTISDAVDSLFNQSRPGVLSVSVVVAVFTLSRGFAGLIRALDVAYDVEESRRFFRLRMTAIAMALGTMITRELLDKELAPVTGLVLTANEPGDGKTRSNSNSIFRGSGYRSVTEQLQSRYFFFAFGLGIEPALARYEADRVTTRLSNRYLNG